MSSDQSDQRVAGIGMLIASYTDANAADAALHALKEAEHGGFAYDDAAVVRRDAGGQVHVEETGDMSSGQGARIGAAIGGVIGILGGPAGVALGAGAGAALGGAAAHSDAGFNDDALERIGGALPAGTSALAVTTSKGFVESVRSTAAEEQTLTMAQDIADEISGSLNAGQDLLMALLLTEDVVAATRVVSGPDALGVFGIVAAEEGP